MPTKKSTAKNKTAVRKAGSVKQPAKRPAANVAAMPRRDMSLLLAVTWLGLVLVFLTLVIVRSY